MSIVHFPDTRPPTLGVDVDRVRNVVDLLPIYIDLAARIANTEFVPKDLRRRPEAVLAALMSGAERGLGPMESLRSINVIEGRPGLSSEAQRALVLAAGHDIEIVESTAAKATLMGKRAGSERWSPAFTWTMDRARRARLANKDNWVKYPEAMLLARASADMCRAVFPDVIAGLAATEEVADELAGEPTPATTRRRPPASGRRTPSAAMPGGATPPAAAAIPAASRPSATPQAPVSPTETSGGTDTIPGADRPTWAPQATATPAAAAPPEPQPPDPSLARRIHAEIAKAFPDTTAATRDRWRHALVAVVTRRRADGPATSSNDLALEEQLELSKVLTSAAAGRATVADGPDDTIELRVAGGWRYTITLDPPTVTVARNEPAAGITEDSEISEAIGVETGADDDQPDDGEAEQ